MLINVVIASSININLSASEWILSQINLTTLFIIFLVTFLAACYFMWSIYVIFAEYLDPSGQCIVGFILPVLSAFIATLNWSAFSVVGSINFAAQEKYLGRFDLYSLGMIFTIFMLGAMVWGIFMKTPEYDDKPQENVAAGYTVLSYWFGFIMFSWAWLIIDRLF